MYVIRRKCQVLSWTAMMNIITSFRIARKVQNFFFRLLECQLCHVQGMISEVFEWCI